MEVSAILAQGFYVYYRPHSQVVQDIMFSSLHSRVRTPLGLYYYTILTYADWCNSNIIGSCPIDNGANPLSVLLYIIKRVIA